MGWKRSPTARTPEGLPEQSIGNSKSCTCLAGEAIERQRKVGAFRGNIPPVCSAIPVAHMRDSWTFSSEYGTRRSQAERFQIRGVHDLFPMLARELDDAYFELINDT